MRIESCISPMTYSSLSHEYTYFFSLVDCVDKTHAILVNCLFDPVVVLYEEIKCVQIEPKEPNKLGHSNQDFE